LCELRNVSFEGGNLPDYNDRAQVLLYCLRYHFGYAFEYEYIYNDHILNNYDNDQINVFSVGCGNGIDLWSLNHAINRSHSSIEKINYLGIDLVDWKEYFYCSENDNVTYYQCDIHGIPAFLDSIDVLIFPKSISELKEEDIIDLADIICNYASQLYIVALFRTDSNNLKKDCKKFDKLVNLLIEKGFRITEGETSCYYTVDGPNAIISNCSDYKYPDDTLEYLSHLFSNCIEADMENYDCQNICSDQLSRSPILTTSQVRYNCVQINR